METISYSEKAKGWTSFHSFVPDFMTKLNNRFFSIKNGQVWMHNDQDNPIRNNFYGNQFNSLITTIFNENPSDDKIFKTLILEGTHPWKASIKTNYTEGEILQSEFDKRESRWFAHTRKSENNTDYTGGVHGVGVILALAGSDITFLSGNPIVSVGDVLMQLNGASEEEIGIITNISGNVITVGVILATPVVGLFCFAKKDSRIEGSEIRGYFMEVKLENDDTEDVELFSINTNAIKSYV